ncbi:MAG TPA: hypothetical protein VE915_02395, partial [Actinomycetota bacterium]|nr:hypothetical protein [Actinomycetota bacterium]
MAVSRLARLRARLRKRTGSIRVRTTAAAVLVVGVSLLIAAVAMVVLLKRSLREHVQSSAHIRAEAIADELQQGASLAAPAVGDEDEEFVQVLDADGRVMLASPNVSGEGPLARLAAG